MKNLVLMGAMVFGMSFLFADNAHALSCTVSMKAKIGTRTASVTQNSASRYQSSLSACKKVAENTGKGACAKLATKAGQRCIMTGKMYYGSSGYNVTIKAYTTGYDSWAVYGSCNATVLKTPGRCKYVAGNVYYRNFSQISAGTTSTSTNTSTTRYYRYRYNLR